MPGEVKMRSKVFPVKWSLSRTNPDEPDVMCRRCHVKPETMGHVVGECVAGKLTRVRRHDKIIQLIAVKCIEASTRTQVFDTEEGSLRPDLVVLAGQCALDIDVTVRCWSNNREGSQVSMNFWRHKNVHGGDLGRGVASRLWNQRCNSARIVKGVLRTFLSIARCHLDFE